MKFRKLTQIALAALLVTGIVSCKDSNSIYDPDYKPSQPDPVITNITPEQGYLAGVDSVIVYGENFATHPDSLIINFGGSAGIVKKATKTELVVRPGTKHSESSTDSLDVRVGVRGAEFFSNTYSYYLAQPFGIYPGLEDADAPNSPIAIDDQNNVYVIINNNGFIRYTKITPDGTVTTDDLPYSGEKDPNTGNLYPGAQTMRFNSYAAMAVAPNGDLVMASASLQAIFSKTFGTGDREGVYAVSSNSNLKVGDLVFDGNGYMWVVGRDSDAIHRFPESGGSGADVTFPFEGSLSAVAYNSVDDELYVGGKINEKQQVWKFDVDGSGNLTNEELYFDFGAHYQGVVASLKLAQNGELLIATGPPILEVTKPSIVRVFPSGKHEVLYEGMIKPAAFSINWRDDNIAVVGLKGEESSVNFLDMYDRTRAKTQ